MKYIAIILLKFDAIIQIIKLAYLLRRSGVVIVLALASYVVPIQLVFALNSSNDAGLNDTSKSRIVKPSNLPVHLSEKFYRQALYFYFQNQPNTALQQLEINLQYFAKTSDHVSLFKAGLQINQGLHQEAYQLLTELSSNMENKIIIEQAFQHDKINTQLQKKSLMLVVLLQLAELKVEQQQFSEAQIILQRIISLPTRYLPQYYVLQQLISWPKQPLVEELNLDTTSKTNLRTLLDGFGSDYPTLDIEEYDGNTSYIILNEALIAMKNKDFLLAEDKLKHVKSLKWQQGPVGFWQGLFSGDYFEVDVKSYVDTKIEKNKLNHIEQNGISHYAQLLLAQLYIEQGYFKIAYKQLESFPKNTVFSEQALFLFGYSASKLKKTDASEAILNQLISQYPYSDYTYQAWGLSASQYVSKNQLNKALNRYIQSESYYQEKLSELSLFNEFLENQKDLLPLYRTLYGPSNNESNSKHSLWLNVLLKQTSISTLYKQLQSAETLTKQIIEQQSKSDWLASAITLNTKRYDKIRARNKDSNHSLLLQQINDKKIKISEVLNNVDPIGNGQIFANLSENKQLQRIHNSVKSLTFISKNKTEYQQRLNRVQGVLTWQLQQQFPDRFWEAKKSLKNLNKIYLKTHQHHNKVESLLLKQRKLLKFNNKQIELAKNAVTLLNQTKSLRHKISTQLLQELKLFIQNEKNEMKQFLLINQRDMARLIEKINKQETNI